ncbi:hypothetical protein ACQ4PT_065458 [Festuca glaucescens]
MEADRIYEAELRQRLEFKEVWRRTDRECPLSPEWCRKELRSREDFRKEEQWPRLDLQGGASSFIYEEDGHTTGMCPSASKPATLQWYGYALDSVGFHCLEMDEALCDARVANTANTATVIINEGEAHVKMTPQLLEEDLKKMVDNNWDWRVHQINDTDFAVVFPNATSLSICKGVGRMTLPVSKVAVIFAEPKVDPLASLLLSKIWLHLSDVPDCLRNSELLLEGLKMLGRLRMVDEESLKQVGPVRMLFHCHMPSLIPRSVLLFTNMQGYRIGMSIPQAPNVDMGPSPPPPDNKDQDDDEVDETEDQSRSGPHWKHQPTKEKELEKEKEVSSKNPKSQPAAGAGMDDETSQKPTKQPPASIYTFKKGYYKVAAKKHKAKQSVGTSSVPLPLAKDHSVSKLALKPVKSKVSPVFFNQYGYNISMDDAFEFLSPISKGGSMGTSTGRASSPIQVSSHEPAEEDSPPISPSILKTSKLAPENREEMGWVSPKGWEYDNMTLAARIAHLKRKQDGEVDNPSRTAATSSIYSEMCSPPPATRPRPPTTPISGTRRSARGKRAEAETILQKAIRSAASKDSGTLAPSTPLASFLAFPSLPDSHFLGVAHDSSIIFDSSFGAPIEHLSLIRAKEVAQSLLAEAIAKEKNV